MPAKDRVLFWDNKNGKRVYALPPLVPHAEPTVIVVETICQMTFASATRQGKALAMAGLQNGLLH